MKARNLTAIAVVATGAIALGAPAAFAQAPDVSGVNGGLDKLGAIGKSAKKQARAAHHSAFQKRTGEDIKRLGNNVAELRRRDDQINSTISSLVSTITPILTQLGAAATSYANFEYGVVQVIKPDGTAAAGSFLATPRIDPTVEQSTVTGQFAVSGAGVHKLKVAVRSANATANDAKSKVYCRVTGSIPNGGFVTSAPNAAFSGAPAYEVARSPLVPTDPAELTAFPLSMVSTDQQVDLTTGSNSAGSLAAAGATAAGTGVLHVTLSCLSVPNS